MTTARDVRDAESVARLTALRHFEDARNLVLYAPPRATDRIAYEHNQKLAQTLNGIGHAWMNVAAAHNDYATELEQQAQVAS